MTAVPISIRLVRAPTAASSGNGDPSCLAKWCTRKYAPSAPSSSAATARSIDCSNASDADRVCEPGDDDQCPNERKPIFFTSASTPAARAAFHPGEPPAVRCVAHEVPAAGTAGCLSAADCLGCLGRRGQGGKVVIDGLQASAHRVDRQVRGAGVLPLPHLRSQLILVLLPAQAPFHAEAGRV